MLWAIEVIGGGRSTVAHLRFQNRDNQQHQAQRAQNFVKEMYSGFDLLPNVGFLASPMRLRLPEVGRCFTGPGMVSPYSTVVPVCTRD